MKHQSDNFTTQGIIKKTSGVPNDEKVINKMTFLFQSSNL